MDSNTTGAYSAYLAFQSVSGDNLGGSDGFNDGGECNGDSVDGSDLPGTTLACLLRYGQSENVSE
uniref:Uncharacterized protein n=1 Tax=Plectus sambesii TaxID=2011161 RepID=A0A914XLD9_9BILA